jgi:C4-dicarboxylate-specific signal transduction histidine kinase
MIELEKLTSMGKMAAGTAHHLNSTAGRASVASSNSCASEPRRTPTSHHLEEGLKFCRKFVQRLLEFARMNPVDKRNHDVTHTIESVTAFSCPLVQSKRAKLVTDTAQARGAAGLYRSQSV